MLSLLYGLFPPVLTQRLSIWAFEKIYFQHTTLLSQYKWLQCEESVSVCYQDTLSRCIADSPGMCNDTFGAILEKWQIP